MGYNSGITTMGGRAGGGARGGGGGSQRGLGGFQSYESVYAKVFEDNKFRVGIKKDYSSANGDVYTVGVTNGKTNSGKTTSWAHYTSSKDNVLKFANTLKGGGTLEQAYKAVGHNIG